MVEKIKYLLARFGVNLAIWSPAANTFNKIIEVYSDLSPQNDAIYLTVNVVPNLRILCNSHIQFHISILNADLSGDSLDIIRLAAAAMLLVKEGLIKISPDVSRPLRTVIHQNPF